MLKMMRKEVDVALDNKLPLSALIAALSLLDGVSKVEYSSENRVGVRYKAWWDEFAKQDFDSLDSDTVYAIRCAVMHETKMLWHSKSIDVLALSIPNERSPIYLNSDKTLPDGAHYYRLDLYGFCTQVCNAYDKYYGLHKDKVNKADLDFFVITEDDFRVQKGCRILESGVTVVE